MARKKKTAAKKTATRAAVFDAPQSRNEAILQNILGANNVLEAPQSRNEAILQAILNGTSYTEEPQSRIEELLICILNGTTTDMVPQSRNEEILIAKIKGEEYTADPQSRIEELLIQWLRSTPSYVIKTVTGNPVNVTDALATDAEGLSVALEPIQDLHGYDSPWPAGGGKNKLPPHAVGSTTTNGVTFTVAEDGTVTVNGTATAGANFFFATGLSITGGILSGCPSGGSTSSYYMNARINGAWQGQEFGNGTTFIGTCDQVAITIANGYTANSLVFKPMIRSASETDASYAPYSNTCPISGHSEVTVTRTDGNGQQGLTLTIPLGDTVYGGTVDVTNGTLTVDRAMVMINGSTSLQANGATAITSRFGLNVTGKANGKTNVLSNLFVYREGIDAVGNVIGRGGNNFVEFSLPVDVAQTVAAGQAWFADNPTQLVYALATPITLTLTPQDLALLQGDNVITSDGEITLTYKAQS